MLSGYLPDCGVITKTHPLERLKYGIYQQNSSHGCHSQRILKFRDFFLTFS